MRTDRHITKLIVFFSPPSNFAIAPKSVHILLRRILSVGLLTTLYHLHVLRSYQRGVKRYVSCECKTRVSLGSDCKDVCIVRNGVVYFGG